MSLRYMSQAQLSEVSGLKKGEIRQFLEVLDAKGVLDERDGTAPNSFLDSIGRMSWFRRSTTAVQDTTH